MRLSTLILIDRLTQEYIPCIGLECENAPTMQLAAERLAELEQKLERLSELEKQRRILLSSGQIAAASQVADELYRLILPPQTEDTEGV